MKLYADRPIRATNQLLGDLLVVAWVLFWVWLAVKVHARVLALAGPGEDAERAGTKLASSLHSAAGRVGDIPLAGDKLRAPFDEGASSGRDFAAAAQAYQDAVADLARFTAIAVAVVPVLVLLVVWLPKRLAWVRAASAAKRLMAGAGGDPVSAADLFALRALVRQPLEALAKVTDDPAQAWRVQDPVALDRLAELELGALGLHAR